MYIGTVIAKVRRKINDNKEVDKPKMSQSLKCADKSKTMSCHASMKCHILVVMGMTINKAKIFYGYSFILLH